MIEDDEMPRRRRGAKAVAVEAEEERGFAMRMLLHSPKDMLAGALAVAAIGAILTNALFLQAGRHPSPMFGSVVTLPAPGAGCEPVAASAPGRTRGCVRPSPRRRKPKPVEAKSADPRSADPKTADPMTNLVVKSTGSAPRQLPARLRRPNRPRRSAARPMYRPPAPIPASAQSAGARRVASVQRALTEYGYGQLKPTGAVGADTQAAISKFERDRKLPVTGQMSDRLVKELTAMIGRPIE